jgi:hypothetical protein
MDLYCNCTDRLMFASTLATEMGLLLFYHYYYNYYGICFIRFVLFVLLLLWCMFCQICIMCILLDDSCNSQL